MDCPTIVRTSPSRRGATTFLNPRRTAAERSVSLRHAPSKKNSASSSDPGVSSSNDSPSSLRPLIGRGSSGESSSNADQWFEQSNNAVRDKATSYADNDPPFFMRHSSSEETPPELQQPALNYFVQNARADSLPLRTGGLDLAGTDGSNSENFRSVIDDLTIENKKLKRRLKKYEKLHDAHLDDEKLFEVRIHGLPPEKKRELEETLQQFASSLHATGENAFPSDGYASLVPMLKRNGTAASSISMQPTDSAYASMSTSAQGSLGLSARDRKRRMTPASHQSHQASRHQNIHNYLHDIPQSLLPQQNWTTMNERAKKKLVVRRLEQLFAGTGATPGGHQQSLQQEEVSQSAAEADRTQVEASGQRARTEGKREASIMQGETEDPANPKLSDAPNTEAQRPIARTGDATPVHANEQRPTRPLDLDLHRAQIPQDNLRYMKHLGFSPPDYRSNEAPEDGHGWIYLNFLINMAQLHTLNVTSDFIRKALEEVSGKFEISDDGRKVRWRGGQSVTRTSSNDGGTSSHGPASEESPNGQSAQKRVKLSQPDGVPSSSTNANGRQLVRARAKPNKHAYTPVFFHRDSTDETDSSSPEAEADDSSSPWPDYPAAGESSAMTSSGAHTTTASRFLPKKKSKHDNGPIIFYNKARFCTDLSGDSKGVANKKHPVYNTVTTLPIGKPREGSDQFSESRGPLDQMANLPEPMDLGDNPIPDALELAFPDPSPMASSSSEDLDPIDLEVTGIGGVWPADNFSIAVNSRYVRVHGEHPPSVSKHLVTNAVRSRLMENFEGSAPKTATRGAMQNHVIRLKLRELPPSTLPDALNFMPDNDDSADEDGESDADDSMSDVAGSSGDAPAAAPQPVDLPYDPDDDIETDYDEESDSEVDFLAAARALNPEAVRQSEREYEANMAERLAEEIPTGSSAATAGGGSGFNSPENVTGAGSHRRPPKDVQVQAANIERLRTATQAQAQGTDGDTDTSNASS